MQVWPVGLLIALCLTGCARPAVSEDEIALLQAQAAVLAQELAEDNAAESSEEGGIVVRLAFSDEADLDLYVTDPLLETVYFARHETRSGGVIGVDVRCETVGPRVEEVRFPESWPGRYRVGVDFPRRCDGQKAPAPTPYAVTVNANGDIYSASGVVNLEYFEVVVLEFEVAEGET